MNCERVSRLLLSYLDNEVSPKEGEAVQAHLSACYGCREELGALATSLSISALLIAAVDICPPYLVTGLKKSASTCQMPVPNALRNLT